MRVCVRGHRAHVEVLAQVANRPRRAKTYPYIRGQHESSVGILTTEGEGGTHHSSKDREKEENMREVRSG